MCGQFSCELGGRLALNERVVGDLAAKLGVSAEALLRPLSEAEAEAWSFYRVSVRHRLFVWHRVQASWECGGLSMRLAAAVMDVGAFRVAHALKDSRRSWVLGHGPASRLAAVLQVPGGAGFFLQNAGTGLPPGHGVEEAVLPLSRDTIERLYAGVVARKYPARSGREDDH